MKMRVHHACVAAADFDWYFNFFTEVFDMTVQKSSGEAPNRQVWFNEGIQLKELPEPEVLGTAFDHISLGTEDPVGAAQIAIAHGCRAVPEKKEYWFEFPNGLKVEMKPY